MKGGDALQNSGSYGLWNARQLLKMSNDNTNIVGANLSLSEQALGELGLDDYKTEEDIESFSFDNAS